MFRTVVSTEIRRARQSFLTRTQPAKTGCGQDWPPHKIKLLQALSRKLNSIAQECARYGYCRYEDWLEIRAIGEAGRDWAE
jgi:hypothetical protein